MSTSSGTKPDIQDFISGIVYWYAANVMNRDPSTFGRVTGSVTFQDPAKSMLEWYDQLQTAFLYFDSPEFYSSITLQAVLLLYCAAYKSEQLGYIGLDAFKGNCYDNAFADVTLKKGYHPYGVFGYYDLFTWKGYLELMRLALYYYAAKTVFEYAFEVIYMGSILFFIPDLRFCKPGEWMIDKYDICVEWFSGGGSDIIEFGESSDKTKITA